MLLKRSWEGDEHELREYACLCLLAALLILVLIYVQQMSMRQTLSHHQLVILKVHLAPGTQGRAPVV
jgi:hypothetical protein